MPQPAIMYPSHPRLSALHDQNLQRLSAVLEVRKPEKCRSMHLKAVCTCFGGIWLAEVAVLLGQGAVVLAVVLGTVPAGHYSSAVEW